MHNHHKYLILNGFYYIGLAALACVSIATRAQQPAAVQSYPTKPIRFIVPQATGGSNDTFARYLSVGLTERLGKQVVVDNRAGADGIIGTEIAARSAPDGHTWLMASGAYAMNAAVRKMPYDAAKSFDWIATLGNGTTVLTINLNFPVNSVKDILALGKAKPGYINLASAGGFQHFISELFRYQSGLNLQILLYKGGYPALLDVVSGQAHMQIGTLVTSHAILRAGKARAIATAGRKRTALMPELPTISESGLPGYEIANYWAIATPAGTPTSIIDRINKEIAVQLNRAETQKRFAGEGAEVDIRTPAETSKLISEELMKWARVAREAGMKFE